MFIKSNVQTESDRQTESHGILDGDDDDDPLLQPVLLPPASLRRLCFHRYLSVHGGGSLSRTVSVQYGKERAVGILLECILVSIIFHKYTLNKYNPHETPHNHFQILFIFSDKPAVSISKEP